MAYSAAMAIEIRRLGADDADILHELARDSPLFDLDPAATARYPPLAQVDASRFLNRAA